MRRSPAFSGFRDSCQESSLCPRFRDRFPDFFSDDVPLSSAAALSSVTIVAAATVSAASFPAASEGLEWRRVETPRRASGERGKAFSDLVDT